MLVAVAGARGLRAARRRSLSRDLSQLGGAVRQSHVQLLGAFDDGESLLGRDSLGNLAAVGAVVHEQEFNFGLVSDEELLEAGWEHVTGLLVLLAADLGVDNLSSEATSLAAVHTALLSPGGLHTN